MNRQINKWHNNTIAKNHTTTGYNYGLISNELGGEHIIIDSVNIPYNYCFELRKTTSTARPILCESNKKTLLCVLCLASFAFILLIIPSSFSKNIKTNIENKITNQVSIEKSIISNAKSFDSDCKSNTFSYNYSPKGMTTKQLSVTEQLISLFENGTTTIQYGYAENIDDGVGITCGRAGFCTGTGDALEVIKNYTKEVPDNRLSKYIPELQAISDKKKSSDDTRGILAIGNYYNDWKNSSKDPIFCAEQDKIFYEWYYEPSCEAADKLGAKYALTRAVLFDTAINHGPTGMDRLITKTNTSLGGTVTSGISEKVWLKEFLNIREAALTVNKSYSTSCRVRIFFEIYNAGNFDLSKTIVVKHRYYKGTKIQPL